jgi:hypothetical protein
MGELPLQNNLAKRHPDVYLSSWKCVLCQQEQESWSHIWRCPHLLPHLTAFLQETKRGFEQLILDQLPQLPPSFKTAWDALPCWTLPTQGTTNTLTFDYLVMGIIPSSLTTALKSIVRVKEAADITSNIIFIAQKIFHDDIWSYRCDKFLEWESSKGISNEIKRASSSGFRRYRSPANNNNPSTASSSRWKSWIAQSIDTGRPWLGFQTHINSLVLGLVQH